MSAEYGRLEMVKFIVKISRWCSLAVVDSGCTDVSVKGRMVVLGSGVVVRMSGPRT